MPSGKGSFPDMGSGPTAANRCEHPAALHRLVLRAVDNSGPGTGRGERGRYDGGMTPPGDTYALLIIVEPAEGAWHAYCPTLLDYGAATWAATREEAFAHISEVVRMVVARLVEDGVPVPVVSIDHEPVAGEQIVTVQVPTLDVAPPA